MILQNLDAVSEKNRQNGVLSPNFRGNVTKCKEESFLLPTNLRRVATFRENRCRNGRRKSGWEKKLDAK